MGRVISQKGVAADPAKNKAILEWTITKDVHDIRSFMGLIGYYRRLIEFFSRIAHPITMLQNKSIRFISSQQSLEEISI